MQQSHLASATNKRKNPAQFFLVALATLGLSSAGLCAQANSFLGGSGSSKSKTTASKGADTNSAGVHDFSTNVRNGILTVDGMVGKAGMNYDIHQSFMYFTIPGVGTAIVGQTRFMNAAPQKDAFQGNEMKIKVNGHLIELTNSGPLVKEKSAEAWVAFDPLYGADVLFPEMGFGNSLSRPYAWPGSKAIQQKADAHAQVVAPPLPKNILPKPEIASSYSVTVPAAPAKVGN